MSKREKQFYCKVGQAVCNITGTILFFALPLAGIAIANTLSNILF